MNYTHKHIAWKAPATDAAIPTNSRPFHNKDKTLQTLHRTPFKANPIKAWRKALNPYYKTKSSKQVSISQIEGPTTANTLTVDIVDCTREDHNFSLLKENIHMLSRCNGIKYETTEGSRCIGGTNNVRRSASTNIKPNYYTSNSAYLKAKCKTHSSRSLKGAANDDGTYNSVKCAQNSISCGGVDPIIYKPSNAKYSQQGAVSASTKILNTKNAAITRNNASLKTAYGNSTVFTKTHHDTAGGTGHTIRYIKGDGIPKGACTQSGRQKC